MKYKNKKGGLKNIEYKTIIYQKQKQKHMLAKKEGKGKIMRNIRNKKMTKTSNNQLSNTTYANAIKNCTLWILIVALVITPMQYQSYILMQKIQKLEEEYKTKNVNVNQKYPVAGVSNLLNDSMEKNNTVSISKLDNDILTASYVDTIVLLENIIKEGEKNKDTETNDQNTEKKAKSNKKENDKQSSVTELDEEIKYYHPTFTLSTNIKSSSGLTAKQIDKLVKDTGLYGLGGAIKDIEDIYGINAYFTLGVASLESGYGKSNLAKSKNNCFGISTSRVFNNKAESVYYFGHIIDVYDKKHNIKMNTSEINKRYCELSSWTGHVVTIMNKYVNDANKIF